MSDGGPRLNIPVGPDGYAWWYVDGLSDDGRHGITIICLIGSVFSPYYAWARRKGPVEAERHVAMNVALYGRPGARWAMTERGAGSLERTESLCRIGPSRLTWTGQEAVVELNEMAVPIPRPIRGRVTVTPKALNAADFELDAAGRHRWWPVAPCARIKVEMDAPRLSWEGTGYLDSNRGSRPLVTDFQSWNWSRTDTVGGDTVVHYDVIRRGGERFDIAHRFRPDGTEHAHEAPPPAPLPPILWRVDRTARSEDPASARVLKTLEDTPFYSRSAIRTVLDGAPAHGVHESLNLDRFDSRWVQVLLPFRMPRLGG